MILITSDWQAAWENLWKCRRMIKQMLAVCLEHEITDVVNLGDLKEQYNPVDVRVFNFWVWAVKLFRKHGIKLWVLKGNHDRVGMHDSAGDWFPTLRAFGAHVITEPELIEIQGLKIYAVPYIAQYQSLRKALAAKVVADVLFFHNEVKGAKWNNYKLVEEGISAKKLGAKRYRVCYGGHIHLYQQIVKNAWFVGSPFSQDWGEANQRKGFLLFDPKKCKHKFIDSTVPGKYDPLIQGMPESDSRDSWKGCEIRIHATPEKFTSTKRKAEDKYPGAEIIVVPKAPKQETVSIRNIAGTDAEVVTEYVNKNIPKALLHSKDTIIERMVNTLGLTGTNTRTARHVTLLSAEGHNFLSYKHASLDFRKDRGIVVVLGHNKDGPGVSNGSGKSSLVQLPLLPYFGKTIKGQAHDKIRNSKAKGTTRLVGKARLSDGRVCKVVRTRHPTALRLYIDGKPHSTGIGTRGTQAAIEKVTGLTWEAVQNAVYVTQEEVNQIIGNSDASRKAVFAKLLNLERFGAAHKLVSKELSTIEEEIESIRWKLSSVREAIASLKDTRQSIKPSISLITARKRCLKLRRAIRSRSKRDKRLQRRYLSAENEWKQAKTKYDEGLELSNTKSREILDKIAVHSEELHSIVDGKNCPVCKRPMDHRKAKKRKLIVKAKLKEQNLRLATVSALWEKIQEKYDDTGGKYSSLRSDRQNNLYRIEELKTKLTATLELETAAEDQDAARKALTKKINTKIRQKNEMVERMHVLVHRAKVRRFMIDCFSKKGLPAFLVYQLCPLLNAATTRYAALFTDGKINVQFEMTEQDIDVVITNRAGGKTIADQSQGELKLAGIITSLSLREVINPCNILVLDEPGESLDPTNARNFAKGLKEVAERFGTVFVCSHNVNILSELASCETIHIVKEGGISRVQHSDSNVRPGRRVA